MPLPLSKDHIDRIIAYLEAGISPQSIVGAEGVGIASIYRIKRNLDGLGQPMSLKLGVIGQPKLLTAAHEDAVLEFLTRRPNALLEEIREWI